MIIADENIHETIIIALRQTGYFIYSIKESLRGIDDYAIARLSINPPRIILTEDKDFGEIVFVKKLPVTGIIFLRYPAFQRPLLISFLLEFLETQSLSTLTNKFVTITPDKLRINKIKDE